MKDKFPTKKEIEEKLNHILYYTSSDYIDTYCRWIVEQFLVINSVYNLDANTAPTAYTGGASTAHFLISEIYYKTFVENAWNLTIIGFLNNKNKNIVIKYSDGLCTDGLLITGVTDEGIKFLRNAYTVLLNNFYINRKESIKEYIDKNRKVVGFKWIGFTRSSDQEGTVKIDTKYVLNYIPFDEDIRDYFLYEDDKLYKFVEPLLNDRSVFFK